VEATYTKCETGHSLYPLPSKDYGKVKGRDRTKGRGSGPSRHIRAREGRRANPVSSIEHPNRLSLDPTTQLPWTVEVELL